MDEREFIVNFTPTGMIPTRAQTPYVPLTPAEIIEDVLSAAEIGISMVHLHVRDPQSGAPDFRPELYAEVIDGIRRYAPEIVIGVSLSGRHYSDFESRSAVLHLTGAQKPDMGSLTLSSLNFNRTASINAPDMIRQLAELMLEKKIKPECEAFDTGMINYAQYLIRKNVLQPPYYFNLILGNIACAQADLLHSGMMIAALPPDSLWSLGGIGDFQFKMNMTGILYGGGVRVGLEDNLFLNPDRKHPATNQELLRRIQCAGQLCGRKVMPSAHLRQLLGLEAGNGRYGVKA
ncbi:MAG: 3-keto-5-aminohexanoate cleavage protein [Victivallaceae bacterium]|nr:3-keto-5-aminohexanoate cleavage protein [Victivallaceae bacterium]